jgi:hypothetical protein
MRTRGLGGYAGDGGQLTGRECPSIHQYRENVGASGIAHELGDLRDLRCNGRHGRTPYWPGVNAGFRTTFHANASIAVEVYPQMIQGRMNLNTSSALEMKS